MKLKKKLKGVIGKVYVTFCLWGYKTFINVLPDDVVLEVINVRMNESETCFTGDLKTDEAIMTYLEWVWAIEARRIFKIMTKWKKKGILIPEGISLRDFVRAYHK